MNNMKNCSKCGQIKEESEFRQGHRTCKECVSKYNKAYNEANKERLKKIWKNYREENREEINEKNRERWWNGYREKRIPQIRAYKEKNKEILKEKRMIYRKSIRGRIIRALAISRREERQRGIHGTFDIYDREIIIKIFSSQCVNCGIAENELIQKRGQFLIMDHHKPLAKRYARLINNAVPLCPNCNTKKRDKTPEEFYTPEKLHWINENLELAEKRRDEYAREE